jgi:uncharacterized protein
VVVTDNRDALRFELVQDGHIAFLTYERRPDALVLVHTEVPPALRGNNLGAVLVKAALDNARAEGLRIVPHCPFARAYLRKHPL